MRHILRCLPSLPVLLLAGLLVGTPAAAQSPASSVDPFIGTANGGNTFPGAVRPWGLVSVSPHTAPGSPSGYVHGRQWFYGMGHVHLSGTGCADLGSVVLTATPSEVAPSPDQYRCSFTDERAQPGYYAVTLKEPGIRLEATATLRCGISRITPSRSGPLTVLLDVGRSLALQGGGAIAVDTAGRLTGFAMAGGFCGEANRQQVYFALHCSIRPAAKSLWVGTARRPGPSVSAPDTAVGATLQFQAEAGSPIIVKVGISYVSAENALMNLEAEVPGWNFEALRAQAWSAWDTTLARIRLDGGSPAKRQVFYTAVYHALIHPNVISDVNGEFPIMGRTGTGRYQGRERYTVFSLWDTYRTLHPFLTLVYPERQSAIVNTMVDMARESGWLPKWELAGNETHMMVGDGAVPVIADTYTKGIRDFDVDAAYAAVRRHAMTTGPELDPQRPGYHDYLAYGYIPFEQDTSEAWWVWGPVSTTLEYCLADWSAARMADALGHRPDAQELMRRSQFYRSLFDTTTRFMRPRLRNGSWLTPFDPLQLEGSGSWSGSGGPGYVEGNAWHYTWFVPHDITGLAALFGGPGPMLAKLAKCFDMRQFTINNEPDIAYPYLFLCFPGQARQGNARVQEVMSTQFSTGPSGLPGNDDAGTLSAWYAFSALGLYPSCPASGEYQLGVPQFRRAVIALHPAYYPGRQLVIEQTGTKGRSTGTLVTLRGHRIAGDAVPHAALVRGGSLRFRSAP